MFRILAIILAIALSACAPAPTSERASSTSDVVASVSLESVKSLELEAQAWKVFEANTDSLLAHISNTKVSYHSTLTTIEDMPALTLPTVVLPMPNNTWAVFTLDRCEEDEACWTTGTTVSPNTNTYTA